MTTGHQNAVTGAVAVTAAGSAVTDGRSAARTHEHEHGTLVTDSPPYVAGCRATKRNGEMCATPLNGKVVKLVGLCPAHIAIEKTKHAT